LELQHLLHSEIQSFISENLGSDSATLALKKNPFPDVNYASIINQISSKKKAKDKLNISRKENKLNRSIQ
jgi:hypothetical protein